MKPINYKITNNLDVINEDSVDFQNYETLFYIKSYFLKSSSGQRMYQYYRNIVKDLPAEINNIKEFEYKNIVCKTNWEESWGNYEGGSLNNRGVILTALIKDRLNVEEKVSFDQRSFNKITNNRFKDMFNYIKLLDKVGTHEAVKVIRQQERDIDRLRTKLNALK